MGGDFRDPDRFTAFYREHAPALLGWLVRQTGDPEVAADLCAETFAAALDGAGRYDPARGPAVAWLYGIAHRRLGHARRRGVVEDVARRRLGMPALQLTDEALERVERLAGLEPVREALAALPAHEREAVQARVIDEQDYGVIARAMKTSESVVRKRVSRGLADMRARLGEHP